MFLVVAPMTFGPQDLQPLLPFPEKIFKIVVNIGYYLCLLPFKISWKKNEGNVIVKNDIQRGLCLVGDLSMILLLWVIWTTGQKHQEAYISHWPNLFWIMMVLFGSLTIVSFIKIAWTKADTGFKMIFDLARPCRLDDKKFESNILRRICDNKSARLSVTFNIFFFTAVILTNCIIVMHFLVSLNEKHTFSWTEVLLFIPSLRIQLIVTLLSSFVTVSTLLIKQRVDSFVDNVLNGLMTPNEILPSYLEMKSFIDHLNEIFGTWILIVMMGGLPYYSFQMTILLKGEKTDVGFMGLLHFIYFSIDLIRAADANFRIHKVKEWLAVNGHAKSIPQQEFAILMDGLGGETIGLKGGKYFTITYKFIGSIANSLLTYAIIAMQWNQP